jgi:hypothetical protein
MRCRLQHKQCLEAALSDLQTGTEDVELGMENESTGILTAAGAPDGRIEGRIAASTAVVRSLMEGKFGSSATIN